MHVDYFTSDETAQAAVDYVPIAATLTYQPGETNKLLVVQSIGDLLPEPDESFKLNLINAQYALIRVGQATGTILNNDGLAGLVHHFDIAPITGVKTQTFAFPMTITARDGFGNVVTNFSNPLRILPYSTNVVATNLDFELSSLAPWTPLTNGDSPGPYELIPYDVDGDGRLSGAFRMRINPGTDGISQNVQLTGGITYTLSAEMVSAQEGGGCWIGAQAALGLGHSNAYWNMPNLCGGQSARERIEMPFTALTNSVYPLNLIVSWGSASWEIPADYFFYADNIQISYPALTPSVLTNGFTNGVWTGMITPLQGATSVVLSADDTEGHRGFSNPVDIQPVADLALTASSQVQGTLPLRTGMKLQFNLALTNRGPSAAPNTVVHYDLPANLAFISATNLQGSISNNANSVNWTLGTLAKGANVTATIVCRADIPSDVTNLFSALASTLDLNLSDNSVALSNHIDPPLLVIGNASGTEAFAGATGMLFPVTLSGPSAQTVTVDYFTVNGTATNGVDYVRTNGTVQFAPGATNATIVVHAIDDILHEPDRSFTVLLSNVVNAVIDDGSGDGTVLDDDPPPTITIADTSVVEGDSGTPNAVFRLTLSKPAIFDVSVRCATGTNTASANDFVSTVATVVFSAGTTNAAFSVPVIGNTVNEPDETFFVNLTLPGNATIARAQAVATILNDDAVPGRLDHFLWDAIPSPRYKGWPFAVTLRALDYVGNPATNGVTKATVTARTENGFLSRLQDDFEDGDSIGWTNLGSSFSAIVTNETAAQGLKSLGLTGGTAQFTAGLRRAFSNSTPNKLTFSARVSRTNQVAGRFTAYANGLYRSAVFYFNNNGQMGLLDAQRVFRGVPYQSNRWYQIELTMKWASQRIDCRVDGALVLTNITFTDSSVPGIDAVLLANQDNTTSWWDDIRVFNDNLTNAFTVSPSNFTAFVNGVKSNSVTLAGSGSDVFLVADDGLEHVGQSGFFDLLPVSLTLQTPPSVNEGSSPSSAQVNLSAALPQAITVNLTSSVPAKLTVPASVTLAANQTNANFNLTIMDDTSVDWVKPVSLSASGTNLVSSTNIVAVVDNDPAAALVQYGLLVDGRFQLGLQGPPARNFELSASSNLLDWHSILTFSFTNAPVMIIDPASTNFDRRFYRLGPALP